jgi:hypothetical protein
MHLGKLLINRALVIVPTPPLIDGTYMFGRSLHDRVSTLPTVLPFPLFSVVTSIIGQLNQSKWSFLKNCAQRITLTTA